MMWERCFFALVLWREARGESRECKIAVACSIWQRAKTPSWWGKSLIDVLKKKWQYSSVTDPNDRQLTTWPDESDHLFEECLEIACNVVEGKIKSAIVGADSYFDDSLKGDMIPRWAKEHPERFVGKVGPMNFYRMHGA